MAKKKLKLIKLMPVLESSFAVALRGLLKDLDVDIDEAEVKRVGIDNTLKDFELEEGSRTAIQYVGTRAIDRDKDIVLPKGGMLDEFRDNPVVLWTHNYSLPPIGKDLNIEADAWGLLATSQYADTPLANEVFALKQQGILKTSSIGFIPTSTVFKGDADFDKEMTKLQKKHPEDYTDASDVYSIIREWILLEHSDVPVPSNPQALTIAVSKGSAVVSASMLKELGIDVEALEEGEVKAAKLKELSEASYDMLMKDSERYDRDPSEGKHIATMADTRGMSHRIVENRYPNGVDAVYAYDLDKPGTVQLAKLLFDKDSFDQTTIDAFMAEYELSPKSVDIAPDVVFAPLKKIAPPVFKRFGKAAPQIDLASRVQKIVKETLDIRRGKR